MGRLVNREELAGWFGVDPGTITEWRKQGLPRQSAAAGRGGDTYDSEAVIEWYSQWRAQSLAIDDDGKVIDFDKERARLTKEQADKAAMANALQRGKLVDAERAAMLWANVLVNCKTRLLSIPTKAAPLVIGCKTMPQARDVIERFVVEALNDLVSTDPTADQRGAQGADTTAETDGEPVGRPVPEVKPRKQRRAGPVVN